MAKAITILRASFLILVSLISVCFAGTASTAGGFALTKAGAGLIPLHFESNQGQAGPSVRFLGRAGDVTAYFDKSGGYRTAGRGSAAGLRMELVGAGEGTRAELSDPLPGHSNYYLGADPRRWRTGVRHFSELHYQNVYPGIDLVYYSTAADRLEFDFRIAPGADANLIALRFSPRDGLCLDPDGGLRIPTAGGEVRQAPPRAYQVVGQTRVAIASRYRIGADGLVRFEVEPLHPDLPVVIDPVLDFSTFLGGNGDDIVNDIAVDGSGAIYLTGETGSTTFPSTAGTYQRTNGGRRDVFVVKLAADGSGLVYSTYIGGGDNDRANAIAIDSGGSAYITGYAQTGFPTTLGVYRERCCGAFVAKLGAGGGALRYSTFLGSGEGYGIAVDSAGSAYITGLAYSSFPVSAGAYDTTFNGGIDAFVTKLDAAGSALVYSTLIGGAAYDRAYSIALAPGGEAIIAGSTFSGDFPVSAGAYQPSPGGQSDGFVARLNTSGTGLVYSTLLGGTSRDEAYGLATDAAGTAYVAGLTSSSGFPTTSGAYRRVSAGGNMGFVTALDPTGATALFSTFLGPVADYYSTRFGVAAAAGGVYVTGAARTGFPVTPDAFQAVNGGGSDAFLFQLNPSGTSIVFSTFLGGSGQDYGRALALTPDGGVIVAGITGSVNFPTTPGVVQTTNGGGVDSFLAKVSPLTASCSYTLSAASATLTAVGGNGSIGVTTASGCAWSAASDVPWVVITSGASGSSSGVIGYAVFQNSLGVPRQGTITVAGQTYTITQGGAALATPAAPTGPASVAAGALRTYSATGADPTGGGTVQYRFDWGDGRVSGWTTSSATNSWPLAGTYLVRAQARLADVPTVVTGWSGALVVKVRESSSGLTNEEFVIQSYEDILNRIPGAAGLAATVNALAAGALTRQQLIANLIESAEYHNYGAFIIRCYFAIMLRNPDYGGWMNWYDHMRNGMDQSTVVAGFVKAPEFTTRYGSLTDGEFVTLVYQNVLGRDPDPEGYANWLGHLQDGSYTRAEMMRGFIISAEYTAKTQDRMQVQTLFLGLYRRASSPAEELYWLGEVAARPLADVVDAFLAGAEYPARFN